ncbi:hypothetical protein GCM10010172_19210 [Paractinoplanes ferrugineus]|uniref:ABM domain-containing protein n=1 Tax=Paractinoplanes ferrugineus TaxID=113564 RepID=A0A919MHW3_9ACTN|nr:antibiotic biosynthesis monooxygenase family protein [Actinoplanes ferrugineus]GIE16248.1 hypothetical protein Afe05nite_80880 [Actinoplanes ferrugineus]
MVRTVLSMLVRAGSEAEFERIWRAAAAEIALWPGCRGQTLLRDAAEPRQFVISSDWDDRSALRLFEGSSVRRQLSAGLDPLREKSAKNVFSVVTTVGGDVRERSTLP